jgi:hypothetical protein
MAPLECKVSNGEEMTSGKRCLRNRDDHEPGELGPSTFIDEPLHGCGPLTSTPWESGAIAVPVARLLAKAIICRAS